MGKSTISMAIFNSFLYVYQRVSDVFFPYKAFQSYIYFGDFPTLEQRVQVKSQGLLLLGAIGVT
jgi:hypothetical protein